jgi:hypothetical protein
MDGDYGIRRFFALRTPQGLLGQTAARSCGLADNPDGSIVALAERLGLRRRHSRRAALRRGPAARRQAALTLGLGIGVSNTLFTIVNALGIRGFPITWTGFSRSQSPSGSVWWTTSSSGGSTSVNHRSFAKSRTAIRRS